MEKRQKNWLSPSEALNRFDLPKQVISDTPVTQDRRLRYGFRLGDIGLLIDPDTVSEVVETVPISPIPNTPSWLLGLINLRGDLIPVFDLPQLLEMENQSQEKQRILIMDKGDKVIGIPIRGLPEAPNLSHKLSRLPPLPEALRAYAPEAYAQDDIVWLEFKHHAFFQSLATRIAGHG